MTEGDVPQPTGLSGQQKTGFVLLLVFALLTVGLGFLQLRNNIYGPFVLKPREANLTANSFVDETTRLQQIDTDKDGINDYEELEFFKTSPYIPDTDSDGILDKDEIAQGSDPICPEGQNCTGESIQTEDRLDFGLNEPTPQGTGAFTGILTGESNTASGNGILTNEQIDSLLANPEQLRVLLRQTGQITEEDLGKFSDEELVKLAEDIFGQFAVGSETTETNN